MEERDYVRTKDGIERIKDIKEWVNFQGYEKIITTDKNQYETLYEQSEIIKSSPNIIDLIEVGDYVNGCKIIDICINEITNLKYLETAITEFDNIYACGYINIYEKDIRTIVTKEQFKNIEYEVIK